MKIIEYFQQSAMEQRDMDFVEVLSVSVVFLVLLVFRIESLNEPTRYVFIDVTWNLIHCDSSHIDMHFSCLTLEIF